MAHFLGPIGPPRQRTCRDVDGDLVVLTQNELLPALNSPDAFILAIVRVASGFAHQSVCVTQFFQRELGFGKTAVAFKVCDLLAQGAAPR